VDLTHATLSAEQRTALAKMFMGNAGREWPKPALAALRRPAVVEAPEARAQQPDSSAQLQALIERQGIAMIPAGTYYLGASLRLKDGQGLVGSGAQRSVLVAMHPDLDLIVSDDHAARVATMSFIIADLSLVGGRTGLRHDALGAGAGAQFSHSVLSHVNFLEMSDAAIVIDGIYGWDNNLIDHVNFLACRVGIRQTVPAAYTGGDVAGMTYLDKNLFYRVQFEGGQTPLEWPAKRPNNLDAFVDSRFSHAATSVMRATSTDSLIFANTQFDHNAGHPALADNLPVGFVGSSFLGGSADGFLDDRAICEACNFERGGAEHVAIGRPGAHLVLLNTRSSNVPLGNAVDGVLINSELPIAASRASLAAIIDAAGWHSIAPGRANPHAQLLVRSTNE